MKRILASQAKPGSVYSSTSEDLDHALKLLDEARASGDADYAWDFVDFMHDSMLLSKVGGTDSAVGTKPLSKWPGYNHVAFRDDILCAKRYLNTASNSSNAGSDSAAQELISYLNRSEILDEILRFMDQEGK